MTIIYEAPGSPDVTRDHATITFFVLGTVDGIVARGMAAAVAPPMVQNGDRVLVRQDIKAKLVSEDAYDNWTVDVEYGTQQESKSEQLPQPQTIKVRFDTTGGQITLTQSLETKQKKSRDDVNDPAPDLKGAINYDGKEVKGVETGAPQFRFSVIAHYAPGVVTIPFMKELARKSWRYNSDTWLTFEAGEVLYMGATGEVEFPLAATQRTEPVPVELHFDASENRTNFAVGDITGLNKLGWDYLWVRYGDQDAGGGQGPVPRPRHAYVERNYETLGFASFFQFGGP